MRRLPRDRKPLIGIVTPCYNEEDVVGHFVAAIDRVMRTMPDCDYRVYVVDDGSRDATFARLTDLARRNERLYVLSLSRNFGHQAALTAGLDAAKGDAVIMMDCDLQHPPDLIPRLVENWREGFDVVSAVRRQTADASPLKRATSRGFYTLLNLFSDTHVTPGAADYCLLSAKALRSLRSMRERHRFLRGMVSWIGYPRCFVEFDAPARVAGESKYTLAKMVRLALDAALSFSTMPLRVATRVGWCVVAAGSFYLAWSLTMFAIGRKVELGWSSLISCIVILGGMQLLVVGILGEYVGRLFEQSKGRPLYVVRARRHFARAGAREAEPS